MQILSEPSSTAHIEPPHVGQKPRRAVSDDRKKAGSPPGPSNVTDSLGKSTQATTGAPDHCWHIRQLQKCGRIGVAELL
jgi:hypothetical protein